MANLQGARRHEQIAPNDVHTHMGYTWRPAEIPFPDVPGDMSFEAQDLITKLLRPNPRQRPSVDQIKVTSDHNRQMMHTHNALVIGCCTSQMCRKLHG
jgi:hypothetical protein